VEFEQKVEIINILDKTDVQNRIDQQNALGWEMVGSSVNNTRGGSSMTLTFKRNKNLKFYSRFAELSNKVDKLRDLVVQELNEGYNQAEKNMRSLPIKSIFSSLLFFGLILFDLYIILGTIQMFGDYSSSKLISGFIYLVVALLGHIVQRKWSKKIKSKMNDNSCDTKVKLLEDQIEVLIEDAKSLDHTLI
jgi:hypothetical protein